MSKEKKTHETDLMDKLTSLCKRRGIVFPSSEIYGGLGSFWDFGPVGVELKRNIKDAWWKEMVNMRQDVVGVETSLIMHPKVWEASGHVQNFYDPMVDCKSCKKRFRADHVGEKCPECGGEFTEARNFNLMFQTYVGPVEEEGARAYFRPETAQGMFVDFDQVMNAARGKMPFGIAQMGKSFRNEISPGNFIFRSREFEQMEIEFFVEPAQGDEWFEFWVNERLNWYARLGIRKENLRLRPHEKNELAHYARTCVDVEYRFPFGWQELEGIANRTDFDLKQHSEYSGRDLSCFDEKTKTRFTPYCIEASAGVERSLLAILCDAYSEDVLEGTERAVLRLHPRLAPIKVGIFPLVRKGGLPEAALKLEQELRENLTTFYDESGSIGRRYRRQDEVGTPYGATVDFKTLEDSTVTLRYRDSAKQDRFPMENLIRVISEKIRASSSSIVDR